MSSQGWSRLSAIQAPFIRELREFYTNPGWRSDLRKAAFSEHRRSFRRTATVGESLKSTMKRLMAKRQMAPLRLFSRPVWTWNEVTNGRIEDDSPNIKKH